MAGLSQVLRAQASSMVGQFEALNGEGLLNKQQMAVIDIDKAIKDLRALENTEVMTQEQFSSASAAIS